MYSNGNRRARRNVMLVRRKTKGQKTLKPRRDFLQYPTGNRNQLLIMNDVGRFAPDRTFVRLCFNDVNLSRGNISGSACNWAYRSSAYDPDPLVGTGAIPGFVELANLYASYRVHAMTADIELYNQNLQAAVVGIWPSNTLQNNNSLAASDVIEYASNPQSQYHAIGTATGQGKLRTKVVASGLRLVGPSFATDDSYASSTSTNPSSVYGINIGAAIYTGTFSFTFGSKVQIIYDVEFFNIRQLES